MKTSSKVVPVLKWILVVVCFLTIIKDFLAISELNPLTTKEKVFNVVGIFLSKFIVLGVHELGYLITRLWLGFRFDLSLDHLVQNRKTIQ
jgi:formate-dependent nitrite reductase membrane component NrfD